MNTAPYPVIARRIASLSLALAVAAPVAVSAQNTSQRVAPVPAAARDSFALDSPLPVDPAVRTGTLSNGIRWYVRRNSRPEQRAELRLVVNAGSLQEDDDQRGLAHFIEHMAFNGTKNFAKNDIVKYLESIGVRFGADLNAYTGFDETVYILPVPTDSAGILERSFRFLGDVATGVLFDSLDVVDERGVVLSEWRTGLGAGERVRDKQFPVVFQGSRYAERLPIGLPNILESANPAPMKRFWNDWYRPDLMAVIAVGDADPARLEALIRQTFGSIPKRTNARPRTLAAVPSHDTTLITIATDKELTSSSIGVLWKLPVAETKTVGDLRRDMIQRLYSSMLNQRFSELAQKPDAPFVGAGASAGSFVRSMDAYSLDAGAKEGKLLESLTMLLTEAERVHRHGFLQSELDRSRTNVLRGYERTFQERDKLPSASFVGEYIGNYLMGEPVPGVAFEYEAAKRLLPTITLAEVNAVDNNRGGEKNRVVTVTMPDKEGLAVPTAAQIRSVFTQVVASNIAPWKETVAEGALVANAPAPGRITGEKKHDEFGVTEWMLSNGIRVFVKPTDFQADQIIMSAWSPGGTSLVSDADVVRASLATAVAARGGLGQFSAIDLQKKLAGKAAGVAAQIGDLSEGLSGSASPKDLETMMQLIWLHVTSPRADTAAYQTLLSQLDAQLRNADANPNKVFSDSVQVTLTNHHPRVRPISAEIVKELDLGKMLAFYNDRFGDAGDFTFLFVGNVSTDSLRPLVEQWIASLPTKGRRESFRDVGPKHFTGHVEKTVKKGIAPKAQTLVVLAGDTRWTRADAHAIESLGDLLEMRLNDRLREGLGGTYSVGVSAGMSRRPKEEWQVVVQFGSAPERAEMMYQAVLAEFDSLRRVPPSADELERVREQQRRAQEKSKKENGWWISALQSRIDYNEPFSTINERDALISGLTADKLHAAAMKFLDETNRAKLMLLPETGSIRQ